MNLRLLLLIALGSPPTLTPVAQAAEGFYPIAQLQALPGYAPFFSGRQHCDSVRVHASRPIYLSALHCFMKSLKPVRVVQLGNPMNYENLAYYPRLDGRVVDGARVIAAGSCVTGFALDVLDESKPEQIQAAIECAKRDWIVYEETGTATACAPAASQPVAEGEAIVDLGAPKRRVQRRVGMTELDGRVFSRGRTLGLTSLLRAPAYVFGAAWSRLGSVFRAAQAEQSLLISDAEAIPGMSGGPVFSAGFKLQGVTTLALVPNDLWRYPGAMALDDGYNFGIHGAIRLQEIFRQLRQEHQLDERLIFSCGR